MKPRENSKTAFSAVVFDAVGTLIYPNPPAAVVYLETAVSAGWCGSVDTVKARLLDAIQCHFGKRSSQMLSTEQEPQAKVEKKCTRWVNQDLDHRLRWRRVVGQVFRELNDSSVHQTFEQLWRHFSTPQAWAVFADAIPALDFCRNSGLKCAVASNFDSRLHCVVDGHPELRPLLVLTSAQIGAEKPDRVFYDAVRETLGISADKLIMIGDDRQADFVGAQAAGWTSLWLNRKFESNFDDQQLSSLQWFPAWLKVH